MTNCSIRLNKQQSQRLENSNALPSTDAPRKDKTRPKSFLVSKTAPATFQSLMDITLTG